MIVAVAIRSDSVMIQLPKPNRHCDCFDLAKEMGIDHVKARIGIRAVDQGFVTDKGVYLDRNQAMRHAKRCGQALIKTSEDLKHRWSDPLFSEDLW